MSNHIDIEIILKEHSTNILEKTVVSTVQKYLEMVTIHPNTVITTFERTEHGLPEFSDYVEAIIIRELPGQDVINLAYLNVNWYVYSLNKQGPIIQTEQFDNEDEIVLSTQEVLPSDQLKNLWENLYYDNSIKHDLLKYAQTLMEFADKGIDNNIISCNRVILLHGPPGTGKTSLCRALAHKLSIRMGKRYPTGLLIEINSHSLFSKWYSESGKLVNKMFTKIREIVENNILVCLLIDEVESLAHARDQCVSGTEPSDSIRVVNALLTQLDHIKMYSNVLIFATSNMTNTIDIAFIDRADIKQLLDLPTPPAIYKIYYSCLKELMKAHVIKEEEIERVENVVCGERPKESNLLWDVCEKSIGLSGRSLKKIPFLTRALFLDNTVQVNLTEFLGAMEKAVEKERTDRENFQRKK